MTGNPQGQPNMTIAFVLPGGSSLGAVQVGMAEALLEAGIRPDLIIGSSSGALNGAWLPANLGPEGAAKLRDLWFTVRRGDVFPVTPGILKGLTGRRDIWSARKPCSDG